MAKFSFAITLLLGMVLGLSSSIAEETNPDGIIGVWIIEREDDPSEKIEIYSRDGLYYGKIIWIEPNGSIDEPHLDIKNKDEELRNRPLLGLEIMKNFKFDGDKTWKDGKFYAHTRGKTVSPKLSLVDKDHLKIQVKILFVKKSFVWERAEP